MHLNKSHTCWQQKIH